jgi:hypothetical protein
MLEPSKGVFKKLFTPGRVKSTQESSTASRPALTKSGKGINKEKAAGIFGKKRMTA